VHQNLNTSRRLFAYQLGLQDRQTTVQDKFNASSMNGINVTNTQEIPVKQNGQSNVDYFKQLALNRLKQYNAGSLKR